MNWIFYVDVLEVWLFQVVGTLKTPEMILNLDPSVACY